MDVKDNRLLFSLAASAARPLVSSLLLGQAPPSRLNPRPHASHCLDRAATLHTHSSASSSPKHPSPGRSPYTRVLYPSPTARPAGKTRRRRRRKWPGSSPGPGSLLTIESSITVGFESHTSLTDVVALIWVILPLGGHRRFGDRETLSVGGVVSRTVTWTVAVFMSPMVSVTVSANVWVPSGTVTVRVGLLPRPTRHLQSTHR